MEISPDSLTFEAPFADQVTKPLYLKNTSGQKLVYKIKTTAPKLYCVRPNASVIEAGQSIEVSIIRQTKDQPKPTEKSKDKFLVLTAPVSDDVVAGSDISKLWATLEETSKDTIVNKKIKVHYDFDNVVAPVVPPPSYEESPAASIAPSVPTGAGNTSILDQSQFATPVKSESGPTDYPTPPANDNVASVTDSTTSPVIAGATATGVSLSNGSDSTLTSRHIPSSSDAESASEIAQQQISSESKELKAAASAKRQLSNEPGFKSAQPPAIVQQPSSGVPLRFVLILALLAFFIGWKLF